MNEELRSGPEGVETVRPFQRISWGAIWAGMFVTVVMQIMFTLLGVTCGIASLNPAASSAQGVSVGAAIWLMVSWLVSMGVGACVAGRASGPRRTEGMVHGVVSWAFSAAVILLSLSTVAGALLSGTIGLLGGSMAGHLTGQYSQPAAANTGMGAGLATVVGQGGGNEASSRLADIAQSDPQLAADLRGLAANGGAGPARSRALDLLVTRHRVDPSQAEAMLNQWDRQAPTASGTAGNSVTTGHHATAQVGRSIWGTSLWAFLALILGLAVAAWTGSMGAAYAPRRPIIGA